MKLLSFVFLLVFTSSVYATDTNKFDVATKENVLVVAKAMCKANGMPVQGRCFLSPVKLTTIDDTDPNFIQRAVVEIRDSEGQKTATLTFEIFDGRIMSVKDECHFCG